MQKSESPSSPVEHDPWELIGQPGVADPGSNGSEVQTTALAVSARSGPGSTTAVLPLQSTYTGSGWTIPLLCLGLGLIACCVLIPQADANRRLAYQRQLLQADLDSVKQQARINAIFLQRVADDPALAERLAERQMKMIRAGSKVLPLDGTPAAVDGGNMSPFQITEVAPPPAAPPYEPIGGLLASVCYEPHCRLYLIGGALFAIAAGLVLGQEKWSAEQI